MRVLLYHAVDGPDPSDRFGLRVTPDAFREQMNTLQASDQRVLPLTALLCASQSNGERQVAITFDDGYRSQLWAATVLQKFGFPATFFVVPRFLDGLRSASHYWETWGHMDWDDLTGLAERGFEIGAHSMSHPDLRRCSPDGLQEEVYNVKALLERRVGKAVVSFSYPYGRSDARVRQVVKEAGYSLACTSRYGVNRPSGPRHDVCRTEVGAGDRLVDYCRKLDGRYDWLGGWQDLMQ